MTTKALSFFKQGVPYTGLTEAQRLEITCHPDVQYAVSITAAVDATIRVTEFTMQQNVEEQLSCLDPIYVDQDWSAFQQGAGRGDYTLSGAYAASLLRALMIIRYLRGEQ